METQEIEHLAHSKNLFFIILITILILLTDVNAQVYPDKKVDSLLKSGIELIVAQDYNQAEKTFNKLKNNFPELPFGNIYLAANKIAEAYDYAEPFNEKFILDNLEEAKLISEKLLDENENNIWYNYFLAITEGYTAYFDALNENWLSAFSTGLNSLKSFDDCLALDNNFYESYIALGTYEYWKTRKTEFMQWLPFVDDDRDDAISKLKIAVDSSSYNSYLAINSLLWIYIDQKKYDKAKELAQNALTKFPSSRSFIWVLARAVEESDPAKAIIYYQDILKSYPEGINSRVNEITLKHIIAQRYFESGDFIKTQQICNEILSIPDLKEFELDLLGDRLERVKKMKSEVALKLTNRN